MKKRERKIKIHSILLGTDLKKERN